MSVSRFVRRTPMAGSSEGREFSLNWGDQSLVRELRVWYGRDGEEAITALQVIWLTDDGAMLRSPVLGPAPLGADGDSVPHDVVTVLEEDDVVNGLYGTYGGGTNRVTSIGLITQDRGLPLLGLRAGEGFRWTLAELDYDVMPDALVTGLFGRYDRSGLRGIGLRCTVDGTGPSVVPSGLGGRVVPVVDAGKLPRIDQRRVPRAPAEHPDNAGRFDHIGEPTPETVRPNPNHVRIDVRRIDQWDDTLRIHSLDGSAKEFRYRRRVVDRGGQAWADVYDGDGTAVVHLRPDQAWIELGSSDGAGFTSPAQPPPAASDGPTWDNVFSLDHRVDYLAWALRGLDISRLAPFNLQESPGVLQDEVFRAPQPGSRDFHIATNGKATVVPNGWQFVGDVAGSTNGRTASAFSDEESRQTWATSLGISAEGDVLGAKVAYRNNSKSHAALTNASSGKVVSTIIETMELSHTLVVDLATVQLADGFRQAVNELKTDTTDDRIEAFAERFGTHFAYAVTYGSKNWEQRHETEESVTDGVTAGTSQDQSVEAGYHGELGGASGSVSWGSEGESASSTKKGTGMDVSSSGSVGSASEPVPILLEVEDLTHLLSPVFFPDPYIHLDLRRAVEQFLDEFPLGFDYHDADPEALRFEISPPTPTPRRLGHEGETLRLTDDQDRNWRIRGGKRHPVNMNAPGVLRMAYPVPVTQDVLNTYPDSGETATVEGLMKRVSDTSRQVWWISGGRRHLVPSADVVEVLGGWELIGVDDEIITYFEAATSPTSVEGKMIRLADEPPEVWVIHERQRHRIPHATGISKRGGWQHVAVVRKELLERFPDSGTPAL